MFSSPFSPALGLSGFGGFRIVTDMNLTKRVPYPRSPARAKRRAKKGRPQHHALRPSDKILRVGDMLVMHPATLAALRAELKARGRG